MGGAPQVARDAGPFRTRRPVRFGDIDHAGIVFYPSLLRLAHEAFEDGWAWLGRPYPGVCEQDHLGFPAVHLEADFRAPLRYGNAVEVAVAVGRLGRGSVTWTYDLVRDDGVAAAHLEVVTATVDLRTFRGVAIPEWCRGLLGRLVVAPPATARDRVRSRPRRSRR